MSSDESASSENEEIGAQGFGTFQGHGSASRQLVPRDPQGLPSMQQLSLRQNDELAITTAAPVESSLSNSGDTVIAGGKFPDANFGPVTQHNKSIHKGNLTHIKTQNFHLHQHFSQDERRSEELDEPSTSGSQRKQVRKKSNSDELILNGSIKIFKNQKLHKTKLIYKGEKTTAAKPISIAVKLMNYSKRALREAESLHLLDFHPNVVRVYDSGTYDTDIKYVFIAMELCSPETLFDYVYRTVGNPNPRQAIQHSNQIISGLEYIHNKGIAHRDFKPHNILFSASGGYDQVKISDFGLSKNYLASHTTTLTGALSGTIGYMAPELINEETLNDSTKCDIFSLGIVLVFRLSDGKHPYGEKYFDWTPNIARGRDPNLYDIRFPNIKQTNDIKRLISKMLKHSPENRPTAQDLMEEWSKDVGGYLEEASGEPQTARGAQVMSSGQGHREEIGRGDRNTERESGRIFPIDMETRIKEVGGGESPVTTRQRHVGCGFIETPGMFGVTTRNELVYWKDVVRLTSDPTVITKLPDSVGLCSVVAGDRCIYLVENTTCYRYDLDNSDRGWIRLGSMKHDHGWYPPAAVLNGKLYVCGMGVGEASRTCEVFTGQWSEISSMKVLRKLNCLFLHGGFLYSIGGVDEERNPLRSVEKYDPSTNTWEIIQPMNVARRYAEAVVYNGKIYVWGGWDCGSWIASCECFDPLTSTWTLSTSDWWKIYKPLYPFVFDNKVLSLLWSEDRRCDAIQQVPLGNESEADLIKVKLSERWKLERLLAVE